MSDIRFIDTTLRDGNQSLWALNMKTAAMVEIAEQMDQAGFASMEFFVTNMFKKYVREHKENPWDWLREGTKRLRKTELRLHGGLKGGLEKKPSSILKLIIQKVVDSGITLTRTSNSWKRLRGVRRGGEGAARARHGMRRQPDLLGVAEAHRRVLCPEGAGSRGHQALRHLLQGRGRPAHSRTHPGAGAHSCSTTSAIRRWSSTPTATTAWRR